MGKRYDSVIVFGPTGSVGSAVCLEAAKRGATVWLAMRDPAKPIPAIQGVDGKLERIAADLSRPGTVKEAVVKSGAKAAFVYVAHTKEGNEPAFKAMKEGSIEYIVFLSSYTVTDVRNTPFDDVIAFIHARAEASLEDLNIDHTALRPGFFASNWQSQMMDTSKDPVEMYQYKDGSFQVDNIVPEDIGRVGGATLIDRPSTNKKFVIPLFGPELLSSRQCMEMIKSSGFSDAVIKSLNAEEWAQVLIDRHVPPPIVKCLVRDMDDASRRPSQKDIDLHSGNVKRYTGYDAQTFQQYLSKN